MSVVTIRPDYLAQDMQRCGAAIRSLAATGECVEVRFKKYAEKRRDRQNRLMWFWYGEIQKHIRETTGQLYDTDDLHEHFVSKLRPRQPVNICGEMLAVRERTSKYGVKQMTEYLNDLDMYCAEHLGLVLPHPEDLYYMAMMR